MIRRVIEIDRDKCNGCGACAAACQEGAIGMVDGKAALLRDDYCDGLGNCLPHCPTNAITFVEREAAAFDEKAVAAAQLAKKAEALIGSAPVTRSGCSGSAPLNLGGCPGSQAAELRENPADAPMQSAAVSRLMQWPIQIKLLPVQAPFYQGGQAADRRGLHRLFPGGLPRAVHEGAHHHDRLPQAGRGGLRGEADGDHPAQRHPGGHHRPHGGALLRRLAAGGGNGSPGKRKVPALAGGDPGPGRNDPGLMEVRI